MKERYLWAVFVFLLTLLPLFHTFTVITGKFQSISEANNSLILLNAQMTKADIAHWQEEANAHRLPAQSFFGTLFKTVSPNVFFNLRAGVLTLTLFNLLLFYLLLRKVLPCITAAFAVVFTSWIPQFSLTSSHISSAQISFFFLLLGLHFLLWWQSFSTPRKPLKSFFMVMVAIAVALVFTHPSVALWNNAIQHIEIERLLSGESVSPAIFSWIHISRAFVQEHNVGLLFWGQQFLPLFLVFGAVVFLSSLGWKKEQNVARNTLFMAACFFSMFSLSSFLLMAKPDSLYLFWPWLSLAAALGFAQIFEAFREKKFTLIRIPLLYSLLICGNVLVCSESPWFTEVQRNLHQQDPSRKIAYLQDKANNAKEPEVYWNQIALINLHERNRLQAKIFALKTLTVNSHNVPARWILKHLHEKELRL